MLFLYYCWISSHLRYCWIIFFWDGEEARSFCPEVKIKNSKWRIKVRTKFWEKKLLKYEYFFRFFSSVNYKFSHARGTIFFGCLLGSLPRTGCLRICVRLSIYLSIYHFVFLSPTSLYLFRLSTSRGDASFAFYQPSLMIFGLARRWFSDLEASASRDPRSKERLRTLWVTNWGKYKIGWIFSSWIPHEFFFH